jgi:hypothetical protein
MTRECRAGRDMEPLEPRFRFFGLFPMYWTHGFYASRHSSTSVEVGDGCHATDGWTEYVSHF